MAVILGNYNGSLTPFSSALPPSLSLLSTALNRVPSLFWTLRFLWNSFHFTLSSLSLSQALFFHTPLPLSSSLFWASSLFQTPRSFCFKPLFFAPPLFSHSSPLSPFIQAPFPLRPLSKKPTHPIKASGSVLFENYYKNNSYFLDMIYSSNFFNW